MWSIDRLISILNVDSVASIARWRWRIFNSDVLSIPVFFFPTARRPLLQTSPVVIFSTELRSIPSKVGKEFFFFPRGGREDPIETEIQIHIQIQIEFGHFFQDKENIENRPFVVVTDRFLILPQIDTILTPISKARCIFTEN